MRHKLTSLVLIGTITGWRGLKGELKVNAIIGKDELIRLNTVWLGENTAQAQRWIVKSRQWINTKLFLQLEAINSPAQAAYLKGLQVFIKRPQKRTASPLDFLNYTIQMPGCKDQSGQIVAITGNQAQKQYVVNIAGKEVLIPAVSELLESVDHAKRILYLKEVEGLLPE